MDQIEVDEILIERAVDGGVDVFRVFNADVIRVAAYTPEVIGNVSGWIGWDMAGEDVFDCADAVSQDAATLGWIATEVMAWQAGIGTRDDGIFVFIDTIWLEPEFRGNCISGTIIDKLLGLLRLRNYHTLVVLIPAPQDEDGGELPVGPDGDTAYRKVQDLSEAIGFTRWPDSGVWWRLALDTPDLLNPYGSEDLDNPPRHSPVPPTLQKLMDRDET